MAHLPELAEIAVRVSAPLSATVHYRELGVPCRVTQQGSVMCETEDVCKWSRDRICVVSTDWLENN